MNKKARQAIALGLLLSLCLMLWPQTARCIGLSGLRRQSDCLVPNPADYAGIEMLQPFSSEETLADGFTGSQALFSLPEGEDAKAALRSAYLADAQDAGLTVEEITEDAALGTVSLLTDPQGLRACLYWDVSGGLLLVLETGMHLAPAATPTPTAAPTQAPATPMPTRTAGPAGHWVWQEVQVDCPSCVGGICPLCHGTGVYRLYGQQMDCDTGCSACDGRGYIIQINYVFVPD